MSSSDFRHITIAGGAPKAERLFRAAVSGFCSLTRPSRREIAQLEDLTLPLFDLVSVEARRYVAAALSECATPPPALVRRLCDETVDIAAPLLIRSAALTDIDLIALIGRHGNAHARAIARRPNLHPTLAKLVAALERKAAGLKLVEPAPKPVDQAIETPASQDEAVYSNEAPLPEEKPSDKVFGVAAENARRRLRSMMRPADGEAAVVAPFAGISAYAKLRETALTGNLTFFHTALADALEIDFSASRKMVGPSSYMWLLSALKALDLGEDQAFVIAAALYPSHFAHPESIRLFLSRYHLLHRDVALERIKFWKLDAIAASMDKAQPRKPVREVSEQDVAPPLHLFKATGSK